MLRIYCSLSDMDTGVTSGIRAEELGRPRVIVLTEENYRVWSNVTEQLLRQNRIWGHVTRTAIHPEPARSVTAAVIAVPAVPGSDAVAGVPAITRAMVDHDLKLIDDYEAAAAKANSILLQSLQPKDIMAVMMLQNVAEKWDKLAEDYASISASMATVARTRFQDFKMRDGESVVSTLHRFDQLVNECLIQAIILTEEDKTRALLTHPSQKWINFMDSYANIEPLPSVRVIFRAMRSQEERWNARNENEYAEANYVGRDGASGSEWKRRPKLDVRQPVKMELRSCYCCGKPGHLSKDCALKSKHCDICNRRGHTANTCRMVKEEADLKAESEDAANEAEQEKKSSLPSAMKPRLSFAKGTKKDQAKNVEGMVAHEVLPETSCNEPEDEIEWLADSGAGRHVCNDLSLMWDVKELEDPVRLVGLVDAVDVHIGGTVKLECLDDWGGPVVLHLYETLFVPESGSNLFSLQKVRIANYTIVKKKWANKLNVSLIKNGEGETVGHINEDEAGRGTVACKTLLPPTIDAEKVLNIHESVEKGGEREEAAGMPAENPGGDFMIMLAPGVGEEEGVGANFGSQLELGSVLEDPTLPANIRVEVESPTKETGAGNSAWGGELIPTVVVALPAVQVGVNFDWESDSSESEFIPVLIQDNATSLHTGGLFPERNFGHVDSDTFRAVSEPSIEDADFDFQSIGFGLRIPPRIRSDEMMMSQLYKGG